jgi:hypothetical protein
MNASGPSTHSVVCFSMAVLCLPHPESKADCKTNLLGVGIFHTCSLQFGVLCLMEEHTIENLVFAHLIAYPVKWKRGSITSDVVQ